MAARPGRGPDDHHVVVYMSSGTPKLSTVRCRNGSFVRLGRFRADRGVDADRRTYRCVGVSDRSARPATSPAGRSPRRARTPGPRVVAPHRGPGAACGCAAATPPSGSRRRHEQDRGQEPRDAVVSLATLSGGVRVPHGAARGCNSASEPSRLSTPMTTRLIGCSYQGSRAPPVGDCAGIGHRRARTRRGGRGLAGGGGGGRGRRQVGAGVGVGRRRCSAGGGCRCGNTTFTDGAAAVLAVLEPGDLVGRGAGDVLRRHLGALERHGRGRPAGHELVGAGRRPAQRHVLADGRVAVELVKSTVAGRHGAGRSCGRCAPEPDQRGAEHRQRPVRRARDGAPVWSCRAASDAVPRRSSADSQQT